MGLMDSLKDKFNETGLTEQLCSHLNSCGLKARVVDRKGPEALQHSNKIIGVPALGCIKVEGCNIEYVEMYRFMEQKHGGFSVGVGGVGLSSLSDNFAYEYTASSRFEVGDGEKDLRAEVDHVTKGLVKKEVVDFRWKGGALADKLNQDAELRSMLMAMGMPWIEVTANRKDGYVEVGQGHARSGAFDLTAGKHDFPSSQMLAVYDRIFAIVRTMRTPIAK